MQHMSIVSHIETSCRIEAAGAARGSPGQERKHVIAVKALPVRVVEEVKELTHQLNLERLILGDWVNDLSDGHIGAIEAATQAGISLQVSAGHLEINNIFIKGAD